MATGGPGADGVAEAAAVGFANNAAAYERSRPSYPPEAMAELVSRLGIGPGRRVLDLAAGTGKLTRLLLAEGADVVAVEPVDEMRAQLVAAVGDTGARLDVRAGTAEAIPLDDGAVDAATVAQAFHWFDPGPALAELHRVLRPDGGLALVWNMRDRSEPWVEAFGALLWGRHADRPYDSYDDVDYAAVVAAAGGFTPVETWRCRWEQPCSEDLLVARAASISVVGTLEPAVRDEVLDDVRTLCRTHPDLAGRDQFGFPYVTAVHWCHRI